MLYFTFGFCWPQPQNVAYPVVLLPLIETTPERPDNTSPNAPLSAASEDSPAIETSLHRGEDAWDTTAHPLEYLTPGGSGALDNSDEVQTRVLNVSNAVERSDTITLLLLGFAGGVFGAVHCLAWNSTFPTPKERLAWRVCSVATTALPIVGVTDYLPHWFADKFVAIFLLILYIIARLTLIALALASLRAAPADVFQTTDWNNIIPHVGL